MATLTGELISETYDSLLKVTDNNTITGIKKRITDGFGNEIPLLLSSTDLEIDGKLILSGLSDLEAGEKFLILYPDNSVGYRTSSEVLSDIGGASSSSISGIINQIAKFDTTGSVTSSIITEVGDKVGIDLSLPNNKLSVNVDLPNSGIDLQSGGTTYARFGIISPGIPGDPGTDNDCYIGSTINNDFLIRVNNTEALRIDTALRLKIANIQNAITDTDKFLVSDEGVVKYRSGLEMLSDLGAVPYTGATDNVDLGVHDLTANAITLDPTPTTIPTAQGSMYFDSADQTVAAVLNGTIMKIGEDLFFQIKNQSGATIPKGTAVRFDGVVGSSGRVLAVPFIANGSVPSIYFLGVTSEDIPDGGDGKAFYFGKIRGMNTNAYPAGTILYASTTVAGGFQTTAPTAPNNIISVAAVTTQGTSNGTILVRPLIGSNINNDEGVRITGATTGDLLQLQASGLWENKTVASLSLVPQSRTLTINGTSFDLSENRSWTIPTHDAVTIGTANGLSLSGQVLSLGLVSSINNGALSSSDYIIFSNKQNALTVSSPLSISTGLTPNIAIQVANSTQNGYLSSTDWNTFNSKQPAGNYVTLDTDQTITSNKTFQRPILIDGNTSTSFNYLGFKQASGGSFGQNGYTSITPISTYGLAAWFSQGSNNYKSFYFDVGLLPNNSTKSYQMPNADGTLMLGSGTTSYIPKFTGTNTIGNSQIFETASGININSTTDAGYKLDVNGTGRFSGTLITSVGNGIISGGTSFQISPSSTRGIVHIAGSGDQILTFGTNSYVYNNPSLFRLLTSTDFDIVTNGVQRFLITSTGAATFSSSVTANSFSINSNGTISSNGFWGTLHTKGAGSYSDWSLINSGGSGIMWNPTGTLNMSFGGNVGIGTTSPATNLHVKGSGVYAGIRVDNTGTTGGGFFAAYQNGSQIGIVGASGAVLGTTGSDLAIFSETGKNILFMPNGSGVEAMRITSGGNVLIGTTTAGGDGLTIADAKYIWSLGTYNNTTANAANMWIGSSGVFGRSTSSIKYKKDVQNYDRGIDVVNKLRPVYYKGINDGDTIFAGLIAEEVHELGLTEFVQYAEDGTPDALAYQNMIALAFKAIQELKAEIDTLKNK